MGGFSLESLKLFVYVAVPVATVYIFNHPKVFREALDQTRYVTFIRHPEHDDDDLDATEATDSLPAPKLSMEELVKLGRARQRAGVNAPALMDEKEQ